LESSLQLEPLLALLNDWAKAAAGLPAETVIGAALAPIAVAAVARRLSAILLTMILAAFAFVVQFAPQLLAPAATLSALLASLVVAFSAIAERRRARALAEQVADLHKQIDRLGTMDAQRFLLELRAKGNSPELAHKSETKEKLPAKVVE
jgi:hypothetical protein